MGQTMDTTFPTAFSSPCLNVPKAARVPDSHTLFQQQYTECVTLEKRLLTATKKKTKITIKRFSIAA